MGCLDCLRSHFKGRGVCACQLPNAWLHMLLHACAVIININIIMYIIILIRIVLYCIVLRLILQMRQRNYEQVEKVDNEISTLLCMILACWLTVKWSSVMFSLFACSRRPNLEVQAIPSCSTGCIPSTHTCRLIMQYIQHCIREWSDFQGYRSCL